MISLKGEQQKGKKCAYDGSQFARLFSEAAKKKEVKLSKLEQTIKRSAEQYWPPIHTNESS